jgi:membrane-associated phospholipid phosphatase
MENAMVNWFDASIISLFNRAAGRSLVLDTAVGALWATHVTGEVLLAAYWWTWFQGDDTTANGRRETLVASVIAVFVALALSLVVFAVSPSYARPIHANALERLPFGVSPETTHTHPAFPSHHALVAFVLVTGLFLVSRPIGVVAAIYSLVIIGGPAVYLGLHYPTDILGGGLLGIAVARVLNVSSIRKAVAARPVGFAARQPTIFYAAAFLLTLQIATLFDDAFPFLHWLMGVLRALLPQSAGISCVHPFCS